MNERVGRYTSKQTYREVLESIRVLQDGPVHSAEAVLDRQIIQPVSPPLPPSYILLMETPRLQPASASDHSSPVFLGYTVFPPGLSVSIFPECSLHGYLESSLL